jgi:hypothetical protein
MRWDIGLAEALFYRTPKPAHDCRIGKAGMGRTLGKPVAKSGRKGMVLDTGFPAAIFREALTKPLRSIFRVFAESAP